MNTTSSPHKPVTTRRSWRRWTIALAGLFAAIVALLIATPLGGIVQVIALNQIETTEFEVRSDELWMNGEINSKTFDQFTEVMDQNPQITTLVEAIVPGSLDDDTMIKLAYEVRRRGLNTKLLHNSEIDSGGVDLFLAGVERTMEDGAHIGVHSWSDGVKEATDYPPDAPEHEQNRKYIEDMLGVDDFYWFTIEAAPADGIYEMTNQEIVDYGLVTGPITARSMGGRLRFEIGALPDSLGPLAQAFSKHIAVWGVNIVATSTTDDTKVVHAANVMAQYLDNDADGTPDNQAVVDAMVANNATLLMAQTPDEFESIDADAVFDFVGQGGQDLYGSETKPAGGFDASLEEVHHLILNTGWSQVFPDQLAQAKGSAVAAAMDIARGGEFDTIPSSYPPNAWFTYDDQTCDYTCMITEYTYWAHTSLLGGQADRANEIGHEWRLETAEEVRATDVAVTAVLEDPALGLPTVLPDGSY